MRVRHASTGSAASSRSTWTISSQSVSSASSGSRSGWTRCAHAAFGAGPAVQFVVRALTTRGTAEMYGRRSRPVRAGSIPSKTAALAPERATRAARSSESQSIRCSIQGGT